MNNNGALKQNLYVVKCSCNNCFKKSNNLIEVLDFKKEKTSACCFLIYSVAIIMNKQENNRYAKKITQSKQVQKNLFCCKDFTKTKNTISILDNLNTNFYEDQIYSNWHILDNFLKKEYTNNNLVSKIKIDIKNFCCNSNFSLEEINKILEEIRKNLKGSGVLVEESSWTYGFNLFKENIQCYYLTYKEKKELFLLQAKSLASEYIPFLAKEKDFFSV